MKIILRYKGGAGSGFEDHAGRPGQVGGSASSNSSIGKIVGVGNKVIYRGRTYEAGESKTIPESARKTMESRQRYSGYNEALASASLASIKDGKSKYVVTSQYQVKYRNDYDPVEMSNSFTLVVGDQYQKYGVVFR